MLVQPLCARQVLLTLGGTPNVWNTCMVFFQAGLLLGYAYAHQSVRWFTNAGRVPIHITLLILAFCLLPVQLPGPDAPPEFPTVWLLQTLAVGVALPFIAIAGCGPLLQRWFADGGFGNPYFLYVASSAGSFAGLLAYPFLIEPWLALQEQSEWWRWGCLALVVATVFCGLAVLPTRTHVAAVGSEADRTAAANWRQRLRWLVLATAPSSLLLSVTNYITTDIAAMPLLWVIPLALYLLTFTVVFSSRPVIPHALAVRCQPLAVLVLMLLLVREATEPFFLVLGLHLLGFFWLALLCHGELARTKPAPAHLTEFFFWLALGGALGGAFNTLAAPLLFSGYAEYPLMIAIAATLRPSADATTRSRWDWLIPVGLAGATLLLILVSGRLRLDPTFNVFVVYLLPLIVCYLLQSWPLRFGLSVGAVLLASLLDPGVHGRASVRMRSFFGVHRVTELEGRRRLVHGNTVHGEQFLTWARRREPLAYYHETGPIGQFLTALGNDTRLDRVGLVGLGAGSLATYAKPGQLWTFFEIDPAVVHIARDSDLFTFLRDSRGDIDCVLGDARLTLQASPRRFGVLVIDAFGSDAIPWHLLTREAMRLYQARLQDNGILAFHISNRYVDLEPMLANHAEELGLACTIAEDRDKETVAQHPGKLPSTWLFLAKEQLRFVGRPFKVHAGRPDPKLRPWTDDFANVLEVLRWRADE